MKKRSKGVIVFAILIILGNAYNTLALLNTADYKFILQPLPERIILLRYFISVIVTALAFISAVGILFLKDFFRKAILFTAFFTLYSYLIELPLVAFKNIPAFIEKSAINIAAETPMLSASFLSSLIWIMVVLNYIIDFAFAIFLIYFFTRPKVKEQFKQCPEKT